MDINTTTTLSANNTILTFQTSSLSIASMMSNYSNMSRLNSSTDSAAAASGSLNQDANPNDSGDFFSTYFSLPRFTAESAMALVAILINFLALISSVNARNKRFSIYHTLFINLCICNVISLVLTWLSNNIFYLFAEEIKQLMKSVDGLCKAFVFLTAAMFVCSSISTVSILTLLGFVVVQYFAICHPLKHADIIRKTKVLAFLLLSWLVSLALGLIPFITLLFMSRSQSCSVKLLGVISKTILIGANCSISIMAIVYSLIVLVCVRIYYEIRQLQKRLSQFRYAQEVQSERKAFITTLLLIFLLTLFYIPYSTVYIYTINSSEGSEIHNSALIYYMNLLPYIKFFLDPLIYGMRMKEIREGCRRFIVTCSCNKIDCFKPEHAPLTQASSVTASFRMKMMVEKDLYPKLQPNYNQ